MGPTATNIHIKRTLVLRGDSKRKRESFTHAWLSACIPAHARVRIPKTPHGGRKELTATPEASLMRDGYEPAMTGKYPR